jgi:hypothetical protein
MTDGGHFLMNFMRLFSRKFSTLVYIVILSWTLSGFSCGGDAFKAVKFMIPPMELEFSESVTSDLLKELDTLLDQQELRTLLQDYSINPSDWTDDEITIDVLENIISFSELSDEDNRELQNEINAKINELIEEALVQIEKEIEANTAEGFGEEAKIQVDLSALRDLEIDIKNVEQSINRIVYQTPVSIQISRPVGNLESLTDGQISSEEIPLLRGVRLLNLALRTLSPHEMSNADKGALRSENKVLNCDGNGRESLAWLQGFSLFIEKPEGPKSETPFASYIQEKAESCGFFLDFDTSRNLLDYAKTGMDLEFNFTILLPRNSVRIGGFALIEAELELKYPSDEINALQN